MIDISFSMSQKKLLDVRSKRTFVRRCLEDRLHEQIDKALSYDDLYAIIRKNGICDMCDFEGLDIVSARIVLNCVVTVLYKYPRLRSKLCFIGSKQGFKTMLEKVDLLDIETLKKLGVQYIILDRSMANLFVNHLQSLVDFDKDSEFVLATAIYACNIFDGIVVDESHFCTEKFVEIKTELKCQVDMGYFPRGCTQIASVIYHELGHLLDYLCLVSKDDGFIANYSHMTKTSIAKVLSQYAGSSAMEFVAEGFAELMSNPKPRKTALYVGSVIDKCYARLDNACDKN